MDFEKPKDWMGRLPEHSVFPHRDAALEIVRKKLLHMERERRNREPNGARIEIERLVGGLKDMYDVFLDQNVKNTKIIDSQQFEGVKFPVTTLSLREFARALYKKKTGRDPNVASSNEKKSVRMKEFICGSFQNTTSGSTFTFFGYPRKFVTTPRG